MNPLPPSLQQAAEQAAEAYQAAATSGNYAGETARAVLTGWQQCLAHLLTTAPEFDAAAASQAAHAIYPASDYEPAEHYRLITARKSGARYQHQQTAAQVEALRAERDQYRAWNDQSLKVAHEREEELDRLKRELAEARAFAPPKNPKSVPHIVIEEIVCPPEEDK